MKKGTRRLGSIIAMASDAGNGKPHGFAFIAMGFIAANACSTTIAGNELHGLFRMMVLVRLQVPCSSALCASFLTALRSLPRKQVLLSLVRNLLVRTRVLLSLVPRAFRRLEGSSDGRADPDGGSRPRAYAAGYIRGGRRRAESSMGRMGSPSNWFSPSMACSKTIPHGMDGGTVVWLRASLSGTSLHWLARGAAQRCGVLGAPF